MHYVLGGLVLLFVIFFFIFIPILVIWSVEVLSGASIGISLSTWFASFFLTLLVGFRCKM